MIKTLWKERKSKTENLKAAQEELIESCGLTPLAARILASRGYDTADAAMAYLEPDLSDLLDPFQLPDMDKAVKRILEARDRQEKICIYGDYDADGTTAAAMLMMYFQSVGISAFYQIPNRLKEGYGLNNAAIERVIQQGAALIITVDNGIAAHKEVSFCKEKGIDIIITDHHECQGALPEATAVVDAKRPDSVYGFSELCGAGIAFKLIQALDATLGKATDLQIYLECVAIATVADIVPLKSENRILASLGINALNTSPKSRGLKALIEVSDLKQVTAGNIGFVLGPKINAAGRLGEAGKVVELYLSDDAAQAGEIAQFLSEENRKRQEIEQQILDEARQQVETEKLYQNSIIVVSGEGWHSGVIGIVASRIQEEWYHPVIAIGIEADGLARGSCRSVDGFNIFDAVNSCKELFLTYGGHSQAAGFSIAAEKIADLNTQINAYADAHGIGECLIKKVYYDSVMDVSDISDELVEELEQFEPFGVGNPGPVFCMENITMNNARKMGSDKRHLMFSIPPYRCVGFGMADFLDEGDENQISILCKPEFNCFRDKKSVQLLLKEIKWSPFSHNRTAWEMVERIRKADPFDLPVLGLSRESYQKLAVSREELVAVYQLVKQIQNRKINVDAILDREKNLNIYSFLMCLNILKEAGLIDFVIRRGVILCEIFKTNEKKDIQKTPLMIKLKKYMQMCAEE